MFHGVSQSRWTITICRPISLEQKGLRKHARLGVPFEEEAWNNREIPFSCPPNKNTMSRSSVILARSYTEFDGFRINDKPPPFFFFFLFHFEITSYSPLFHYFQLFKLLKEKRKKISRNLNSNRINSTCKR